MHRTFKPAAISLRLAAPLLRSSVITGAVSLAEAAATKPLLLKVGWPAFLEMQGRKGVSIGAQIWL
jgi:hypothetical protein